LRDVVLSNRYAALLGATAAATVWMGFGTGTSTTTTELDNSTTNAASVSSSSSNLAPLPPLRVLRPNANLEICYDTRTRTPVYVQHRIEVVPRRGEPGAAVERQRSSSRMHFKQDLLVEERYRSRNSHYHLSGYDRGHMAPAADFYGKSLEDTYHLTNIAPQDPVMNRQIWAWLEEWTRRVARQAHESRQAVTVVTTGPLWLPSHPTDERKFRYNLEGIGKPPALILVPTHFFKVVVVLDKDCTQILEFACFVVPNRASANERPLQEYMVPWSDLETVSGLTFYPSLADDTFKAKADWLTAQQQQKNRRAVTGETRSVLLLTDGKSSSTGGSTVSKWSYRELKHLCDRHACISPKHLEESKQ
jgi:endonuclease G, mitochondrial